MIDVLYVGGRPDVIAEFAAVDLEPPPRLSLVGSTTAAGGRLEDHSYDLAVVDSNGVESARDIRRLVNNVPDETAVALNRALVTEAAIDPRGYDYAFDGEDVLLDVASIADREVGEMTPEKQGDHRDATRFEFLALRFRATVDREGTVVTSTAVPGVSGGGSLSTDTESGGTIPRPTHADSTAVTLFGGSTSGGGDDADVADTPVAESLTRCGLDAVAGDCTDRGRRAVRTGVTGVHRDASGRREYWSSYAPTGDGTYEVTVYERSADESGRSIPEESAFVETCLDELREVLFVFKPDGEFVYWNQRLREVTGYDDDAIELMGPLDFVAPEDREIAFQGLYEIATVGQATAEFDLLTSEGERIPYEWTGSVVKDDDGDPAYVCGIGRDVSRLKRKEGQLRQQRDLVERIFETSPIGVLVLDGDETVTRANSRANSMLAPESGGLVGAAYEDLPMQSLEEQPSDDDSPPPTPFELSPGETVRGLKQRINTDDEVIVSTNATPLEFGQDLERYIVTLEDVTELVEQREELKDKQTELDELVDELQRSNAELEHFAYVASHDLKEPLRVVSNYLQLLERRYGDELDESGREFVDLAVDGANRMRQRVDDLLMYSRIDRHGEELRPVDADEVVGTALSSLAITINESDAEVVVGDLPTVMGDEDQLVQLFQNLVGNAISYSGDTYPSIAIEAEANDDEWILRVEDDGVGIPRDRQDLIFDLFHSGPDSDSTGIGLAICQKIVERHDGRIWVDSAPGEGTTFHVALPRVE